MAVLSIGRRLSNASLTAKIADTLSQQTSQKQLYGRPNGRHFQPEDASVTPV